MPLTHAEGQKRYQEAHESDPAAKNRLAAQKRVLRVGNKTSDSAAKKEYERGLQKVRSQRARDKKKLAKINGKRRKNGQPPLTRGEFDNLLGRVVSTPTQPPLPPPLPSQKLPTAPLRRSTRGRPSESYNIPDASSDTDTTTELADVRSEGRLIVNMAFHTKAIAKREKRLRRAKRDLHQMQRKVWRLEKVVSKGSSSAADDSSILESDADVPESSTPRPSSSVAQETHTCPNLTPVVPSETSMAQKGADECIMRADGISPCKAPTIKKQLNMGNAVLSEIRNLTPSKKSSVMRSLLRSAKIKGSRSVSRLAKELGVSRYFAEKSSRAKRLWRRENYAALEMKVLRFLKRPDNAACMPGKKDTLTIKKTKHQVYILHDYMHVLHSKFVHENPADNCSYSFFAGVRSKYRYIKLISHSPMNMCLCKTHENMRLLLKATSGLGLNRSPDEFVQQTTVQQASVILQQLPPEVKYWEWRTVPVQYGEVTKNRVKRLQYTATRTEFIAKFVALMVTFSSHASRVMAQYKAVRALKETLPPGHVTVQMDFSENWTVCSSNEIQSAYFAKDQITIHPAVVHYRCNDVLMHKSYILVTDERRHSAPTVFQFMKQLVPKIREDLPMNVTFVHYVTDSPSSQYRNTQVFSVLARHQELLATDASWLYFEAGHGKGPCDGVGGASKRMADDYVRRGNTILTAAEYVSLGNSAGKIKYLEVSRANIEDSRAQIEELKTKATVPGTMKYHAAVCVRPGVLAMRKTSCNNMCCFQNGRYVLGCSEWDKHVLFDDSAEVAEETVDHEVVAPAECVTLQFRVGTYVVADFDGMYFVGEVVRTEKEGSVLVKYLRPVGGQMSRYTWPATEDVFDTPEEDIFLPWIPAPLVTGGRNRTQFLLREGLREEIGVAHHAFLKHTKD